MFSSANKIKIDEALYKRLAKMAEQSGYSSTAEFVNHILEREAAALEEELDQQQAEKQLRGLGYL